MSGTQALDRRDAVDAAAVAIMIGLTFSWGLNGVAAKLANAGYNPLLLTVVRSAAGGLLIYLWCLWRGVPLFSRDGTLWAGIAAGLLFAGEFVLIFVALDFTTVARSTLMVNTMPFWVLLGAHFILDERMTMRKLTGLVLAFAGVALVFSDKLSLPDPSALTGDVMSLIAGSLWAATILVIKSTKLAGISAEKLLLYQLAVSAAGVLPAPSICRAAVARPVGSFDRRRHISGHLYRRGDLSRLVLADAPLSGGRTVELHFSDAGIWRPVRRNSSWRTAVTSDIRSSRPDRGGNRHRQSACQGASMIKLVLFDCDGTLVDSAAIIHDCMERTFLDAGLPHPGSCVHQERHRADAQSRDSLHHGPGARSGHRRNGRPLPASFPCDPSRAVFP